MLIPATLHPRLNLLPSLLCASVTSPQYSLNPDIPYDECQEAWYLSQWGDVLHKLTAAGVTSHSGPEDPSLNSAPLKIAARAAGAEASK